MTAREALRRLVEAADSWEREAIADEDRIGVQAELGLAPQVALKRRVAANLRALAERARP